MNLRRYKATILVSFTYDCLSPFFCLLGFVDPDVDPANASSTNRFFSLVNRSKNLGTLPVDASCFCPERMVAVVKQSYDDCLDAVEDERVCLFHKSLRRVEYVA